MTSQNMTHPQTGKALPEAEEVQDRGADELLPLRGGGNGNGGQRAASGWSHGSGKGWRQGSVRLHSSFPRPLFCLFFLLSTVAKIVIMLSHLAVNTVMIMRRFFQICSDFLIIVPLLHFHFCFFLSPPFLLYSSPIFSPPPQDLVIRL